ncbi:MAG: DUF4380 domain-containing protein [Acidobacteria bacterium]|nr:DUF4380 domain-containing protein [Acidobacteriota bacterium]
MQLHDVRGFLLLVLVAGCAASPLAAGPQARTSAQPSAVSVRKITYHGWPDSLVMSNGKVEAVIVPAVGRVMQFRFVGEEDGAFWENRALDGKAPDPLTKEWGNFGGDKSWPAPQADWAKITGRGWPPPPAFDAMGVEARIEGNEIELVSPVCKFFGIRVRRLVEMAESKPLLTITTTYEKVAGDPVRVAVWVITQLNEPERVFVQPAAKSRYPEGYNQQTESLPKGLKVDRGFVSLTRDTAKGTKIGSDGDRLVWVGSRYVLGVLSPREHGSPYPDQESSIEVWTNPDPLPYIDLETLGPLVTLNVGDTMDRTNFYVLRRRSEKNPEAEVRKAFEGVEIIEVPR